MDLMIGGVVDALETHGLTDHTVVFFSGDNGPAPGQHKTGECNITESFLSPTLCIYLSVIARSVFRLTGAIPRLEVESDGGWYKTNHSCQVAGPCGAWHQL